MNRYLCIKILFLIGLSCSQAWADQKESGLVGPYLSAKYAISQSSFDTASKFYEKILNIKDALEENKNGILKNQSFMITGKLKDISRAEAKSLIEENSGTTVSSVSKKLSYLVFILMGKLLLLCCFFLLVY